MSLTWLLRGKLKKTYLEKIFSLKNTCFFEVTKKVFEHQKGLYFQVSETHKILWFLYIFT
jgi:hypothetical protein